MHRTGDVAVMARGWAAGALLAIGVMCGTACGAPASAESAARLTAQQFARALAVGDGAAACDLLTPRARDSVAGATDAECEDAILALDGTADSASNVEVWGDAAQVRIGSDTIFLLRLREGWRVDAAGCAPQHLGPYDCDVES
jgi:hypothetical protein